MTPKTWRAACGICSTITRCVKNWAARARRRYIVAFAPISWHKKPSPCFASISPRRAQPMPEIFRTTRRVEFADTDMAGIVHFANFFRYMEAAEVEFLRSRGLSVKLGWEGQELGFPRVSASCDYQKPARFEDLLEITVRIVKIGLKSMTYGFELFSKDALLAR